MDGTDTREPLATRHVVAWGLAALGLVTIVAMAARGAAWNDDHGGDLRSLPHSVSYAAGGFVFVVAIVLLMLSAARARRQESPEQRRRRWSIAIAALIVIAAISLIRVVVHPSDAGPSPTGSNPAQTRSGNTDSGGAGNGTQTWWPLVMVGLGTAAALVAATARRRTVVEPDGDTDTATRALLDASLDDLRREPDARRAIVAAYARMEDGLAVRGFARERSETPTEYLARAQRHAGDEPLVSVPAALHALAELTALAERARFSNLPIDEPMRARAIDALERLRRDLRPAASADLLRSP